MSPMVSRSLLFTPGKRKNNNRIYGLFLLVLGFATFQSWYISVTIPSSSLRSTSAGPSQNNHDDGPLIPRLSSTTTTPLFPITPMTRATGGGLILFWHIPKSGGTTLRETLSTLSHIIDYRFVPGAGVYNRTKPEIDSYLQWQGGGGGVSNATTGVVHSRQQQRQHPTRKRRRRKILFVEMHGRDTPHLLDMHETIRQWRRMATVSKTSMFVFTLVRDPLSYAISYFQFFHVHREPVTKHFDRVTSTEANLLHYSLWNPQCQFLARGENSLRRISSTTAAASNNHIKAQPTVEECNRVYRVLQETMDWVGQTHRMNQDTIPMLQQLIPELPLQLAFTPQLVATNHVIDSTSRQEVSLITLSQSATETLRNMSRLDMELVRKVQQDYPSR